MIKVLVLVHNDLLSLGIISCLQNKLESTFYQENSWEGLEAALPVTDFDLLVVDSKVSEVTDITTLEKIRFKYPTLKTILLVDESHDPLIHMFLKRGVEGVCNKSIRQHEFLHAYSTIMTGRKYIHSSIAEHLLSNIGEKKRVSKLSHRESQITGLLIKGLRTADVARKLNLATSTISTIKSHIYRKMQVNNIVDLSAKVKLYSIVVQSVTNA